MAVSQLNIEGERVGGPNNVPQVPQAPRQRMETQLTNSVPTGSRVEMARNSNERRATRTENLV